MLTFDGVEVFDAIPKQGGARPGSGQKPKGYVKPKEVVDFEKAKARSEAAKADLAELEYKNKSGQYVSRAVVRQVVATAYATVAQTLRSVPDHFERSMGLAPDVCEQLGISIDEVLADLAKSFEMLSGGEAPESDESA